MISFIVPTKPDWSGLVLSTQNLSDSHCVYQNLPTYLLAHEQIRLLSGDVFRLCALKSRRLNSESTMARAQLALKGNGR